VSAVSFQIDVSDLVLARARRGDVGALEQIYRAFAILSGHPYPK